MKKKYFIAFIFLLSMKLTAYSQNLVRNGCFAEQSPASGCQNTFNDFSSTDIFAKHWANAPDGVTPDYFMPCATMGTMNPLSNIFGSEQPKVGSSYVGLIAYDSGIYSEYIKQDLGAPLQQGRTYNVEFYVSLADNSQQSVNHLGMFFSNSPNEEGGPFYLHSRSPQVPNTFPSNNFYTNKIGWTKISGTYTPARSDIQYIYIGNFDKAALTYNRNIQSVGSGTRNEAYYYIDDVKIIPADLPKPNILGPDIICANGTYSLQNPPVGSISWHSSNTNLLTINQSGVVTRVGSNAGRVIITSTATADLCNKYTFTKEIWVGQPGYIMPFGYPEQVCAKGILSMNAPPSDPMHKINSYFWSASNAQVKSYPYDTNVNVEAPCPNNWFNVTLTVYNDCGPTSRTESYYAVSSVNGQACQIEGSCGGGSGGGGGGGNPPGGGGGDCPRDVYGNCLPEQNIIISPTPSEDYFILSQNSEYSAGSVAEDEVTIKIFNPYNKPIKEEKNHKIGNRVDISNLKNGHYVVLVIAKKKTYRLRLLIQR
jgi:hypothetical protein